MIMYDKTEIFIFEHIRCQNGDPIKGLPVILKSYKNDAFTIEWNEKNIPKKMRTMSRLNEREQYIIFYFITLTLENFATKTCNLYLVKPLCVTF